MMLLLLRSSVNSFHVTGNEYIDSALDPLNFDRSDQKAFLSAARLQTLLINLDEAYGSKGVDVVSHSMGAVVVSEALRQQAQEYPGVKIANVYVASQAAIPADAYDPTVPDRKNPSNSLNMQLPDYYVAYPTADGAEPYFADISEAANTLINYYNPGDYALSWWETNDNVKPDIGYGYDPNIGFYAVEPDDPPVQIPLSISTDIYEIFSFADPSTSKALGAQGGVGGPFSGSVDLSSAPYSFGQSAAEHGAQFNYTLMKSWSYWNILLHSSFAL